jgi:hypothetical protein
MDQLENKVVERGEGIAPPAPHPFLASGRRELFFLHLGYFLHLYNKCGVEWLLVLTILSIPLYGNAIFRLTMQGEGKSYLIFYKTGRMWVFIKNMSTCTYYFYVGVGLQRKNNLHKLYILSRTMRI